MMGLAIGSIKARDEISEVVVIAFRTRLLDTFVLVYLHMPTIVLSYTRPLLARSRDWLASVTLFLE